MSTTITTRQTAGTGATVKGSPLTNAELDANFLNLNLAVQPSGGTAGQVLSKIDGTDFNSQWVDNFSTAIQVTVKAGVALTKGQAVYITGATGANIIVGLAQANAEATSSKTFGLINATLAINGSGNVVCEGPISGIDTSAATEGDPVWLSPSTPGGLVFGVANKPSAPNHMVYLGVVSRAHATQGQIQVKVQNGFELEELHNVAISSVADAQIIQYEAATSLWKNKSLNSTFGSQTANFVYAAPNGSAGTPSFRALVAADIPTLNQNTTGTAAGLSATLAIGSGGTGQTSFPANYIPYGSFSTSASLQFNGTTLRVGANALLGGTTNPIVGVTGGVNNYIQSYIFNGTAGASASADFVAYADNSTDAHGWADIGFTSSAYADTVYTVTGPNEAYVFGSALNSTYTGNLVYATDSTGSANAHQWYVGGFTQAKSAWRMQLTSTLLQAKGTLQLMGSTSGYVGLKGAAAAGSTTYTLPAADGTSTQVLSTDGAGNLSWASVGGATISDDTATNATYYPTFATSASGSFSTAKVSSTKLTYNPSTGTLTATTVTGSSDESLKADWQTLPSDFVDRMAQVKHGVFTRIAEGTVEAGVSAQSWQQVLPQTVVKGNDGLLSVNYGGAALVSAIQIARRLVALEAVVAKLVD
jgi:hypothetical protein